MGRRWTEKCSLDDDDQKVRRIDRSDEADAEHTR
jgi:hypothetical protein